MSNLVTFLIIAVISLFLPLHKYGVKGKIYFYNNNLPPRSYFPSLLKVREGSNEGNGLPPCDEDQLMMYLVELQAVKPEDIINLSTLDDLNGICKTLSASLNKMDNYLKSCQPPNQKDLYVQLIKGVNTLHEKICTESEFKKNFQHHYECIRGLHNDLEECTGPADWTEDGDNAKVCEAYHNIADCYYAKTAKLCGIEAAKLIKELILTVISSVLVINCEEVKANPPVEEPMPEDVKENQAALASSKSVRTQLKIYTVFIETINVVFLLLAKIYK